MKFGKILLLSAATLGLITSCGGDTSVEKKHITIDKYTSDVSGTAPILVSGLIEGQKVDYVVSSQPVIFSAMSNQDKATNLTIYEDLAKSFGEKYGTNGFPQAGLFIKTSLLESQENDIYSFLKAFDFATSDLVNGGDEAVNFINAYSTDVEQQKLRFNFSAGVIKNVQKTNGLAFVKAQNNPTVNDFVTFQEPLKINIGSSDLSKYYSVRNFDQYQMMEELSFNVVCPKGAPAAALARYAASDNLNITSADNVKGAFTAGTADFIVFDSVNGVKLAKANGENYKLVRMVTYGNLYIVATGNDEDGVLTDDDYIVSYGEGLVPDLAFKAVYGEEE